MLSDTFDSGDPRSGDLAAAVELRPALFAALDTLTAQQRAIVVLRYFEDHSENDVADLLGVSPGTVKSTASRTLAQLRVQPGRTVSAWLSSSGATITVANQHYIAVNATVAQADAALDTQITRYVSTVVIDKHPFSSSSVGAVGGFSIPTALSADVAAVTGLDQIVPGDGTANATSAHTIKPQMTNAPLTVAASSSYQCSHRASTPKSLTAPLSQPAATTTPTSRRRRWTWRLRT